MPQSGILHTFICCVLKQMERRLRQPKEGDVEEFNVEILQIGQIAYEYSSLEPMLEKSPAVREFATISPVLLGRVGTIPQFLEFRRQDSQTLHARPARQIQKFVGLA